MFRLLLPLYKNYKFHLALLLACSCIVGLNNVINSYLLKVIVDFLPDFDHRPFLLMIPLGLLIVNMEIHNICWRGIHYLNLKMFPSVKKGVIKTLFTHVHEKPLRFFQNSFGGSIAHFLTLFADNIERITTSLLPNMIRVTVQFIAAILSLCFIHPIFSLLLLLWTLSFSFFSFRNSKNVRSLSNLYAKSHARVTGKLVDSISNFFSIRIFSRTVEEAILLGNQLDKMNHIFQKKERFLLKFYFLQGLSISALLAFVGYSLVRLKMQHAITNGDFIFILSIFLYSTEHVWFFTQQYDQLNDAIGKCNQTLKTLASYEGSAAPQKKSSLSLTSGHIIFDSVSFSYEPSKLLFQNLSFTIRAKEKVGIVGYTGSGKSTFLKLILGLYEPDKGRIFLDGQDISIASRDSLFNVISMVPQDTSLLHRSLFENIRLGDIDATHLQVIEAAKRAHIHDLIAKLPHGYHTLVGEQGLKLSEGQKQQVVLARAFLKQAPLFLSDEPTAHLDFHSERAILDALETFMAGKTVLMVTHRLTMLTLMDRILVFDQGKIVESGSHHELLQTQGCQTGCDFFISVRGGITNHTKS